MTGGQQNHGLSVAASNNPEKKGSNFDVDIELLSNCMDINVLSQMEVTPIFSG